MVLKDVHIYSFLEGKDDEAHANTHRNLLSIIENMTLNRFDFVDDHRDLHLIVGEGASVNKKLYGCSIYTFKKLHYQATFELFDCKYCCIRF